MRVPLQVESSYVRMLRLAVKHGLLIEVENQKGESVLVQAQNAEMIADYAMRLFFERPELARVVEHYRSREQAMADVDERFKASGSEQP
jgi:hypothetical protein